MEMLSQAVPERFLNDPNVTLVRMLQLLFLLLTRTTVGSSSKSFQSVISKFGVPSTHTPMLP